MSIINLKYIVFSVALKDHLMSKGFSPIIDDESLKYSNDGTCYKSDGKLYWKFVRSSYFKRCLNDYYEMRLERVI